MNSHSSKRPIWVLAVLLLTLLAGRSVEAASGFTMQFETPESIVSRYQEAPSDLSVSLGHPVFPVIVTQLRRRPNLVAESFKNQSFRFNTDYYRRGAKTYSLIPVSVDIKAYNDFRRRYLRDKAFEGMAINTLNAAQKGKLATGLGVSVELPKRLQSVFGEGGAGLRVSGYRKIIFSGRSQWTDAANSPVYSQSKFPSLNMEQIYQFDITGTIGSKITVKVSQDSHTDIPLSNRLQIRYKGDDDDVLKTVEAGNTNLSLPNTQFVGYSSQIRGLFGVKAEAQVGSLYLTAIASQEKGTSEQTTVTPTGEESAQIVRDYQYVERRIFDLGGPGDFQKGDSVEQLQVYQQISTSAADRPQGALYANLYVDPAHPDSFGTENQLLSSSTDGVVPVDQDTYNYYSLPDSTKHYIVFNSAVRDNAIGIWMVVKRAGGTLDTIGVITDGTTESPLVLKLLYRRSSQPGYRTWKYMWRNIYSIPVGNTINDMDVKVYKGLAGSENTSSSVDYQTDSSGATQSYLELLGLDQYQKQQKVPDGKIDDRVEIWNSDWGLIIFPSRTPFTDTAESFRDSLGNVTQHLLDPATGIYDYESSTAKAQSSKYFMKYFTKSRSSVINLGHPNIIEGSEKITANGTPLVKGVDYTINYDFGQVKLLSQTATDPNSNIAINFEYAPFLAVQKKTLLGFRSEYQFSDNFKIGSTILYKSDKTQDRKPRVGQETTRSFVFDVDGSLQLQPNFLTRLADALPIVETQSPSHLRLAGEVAQSHPNPNVNGVAYIDDFESSTEETSLGTGRTQWQKSSKPYQLGSPSDSTWRRSKLLWYNMEYSDEQLKVTDVYDRQAQAGESTINSLHLIFRPNWLDTTWNHVPKNPGDTTSKDSTWIPTIDTSVVQGNSWAGIMRYFKNRIDAERVQSFEVRCRANSGIMHLEFGRISEDVNGDGKNVGFDEDRPPIGDFTASEDVGFDMLPDDSEPHYDAVTNPDPDHDDWWWNGQGGAGNPIPKNVNPDTLNQDSLKYEFINGTEGNKLDAEHLNVPDQEKLGDSFESQNGYFSYVIDFGSPTPSPFRIDETRFDSHDTSLTGGPEPPWYTYRIPIRDSTFLNDVVVENGDTSLTPRWTGDRISHIRIWFESEPGKHTPDTVEIADWYFVQNSWRDTVEFGATSPRQTKLVVASISQDDSTFIPPPGVTAYKDPTTNVTESQRGLMLHFDSLDYRDIAQARKQTLNVDKYGGYETLEMYVHGDLQQADLGKVWFYFRLGRDSVNYYEQRKEVHNGWDERNYIKINFSDITALKEAAERNRDPQKWKDIDTLSADGSLRVRGDPNLNEVKYFVAGVMNTDSSGVRPITGEVWLDELRVTNVRRDVGTAARFSANGNIADLGTYSFTYQTQDPYFRGLSSSTRGGSSNNLGSGQTDTRIQYSLSLNVDRFLPRSWNARVPVQFSYAKSTQLPLLRTGSDILLPAAIRQQERSQSVSRTFSVSPSFNKPGKNPLFSLLLNRLSGTSVSYRRSVQRSPRAPYSFSEGLNVRSGYDFGIKAKPTLPILFFTKWVPILKRLSDTRLGLYPSTWRINGTFDRNLSITDDVTGNRRSSFTRTFNGRMDLGYNLFQNLSITARLNTRRDLSDPHDVNMSLSHLKLGLETHFDQSFSAKYSPNVFSWFTTDWTYSASYSDDYERSTETRRSSVSRGWGVGGTFDHIKLLGGKGGTQRRRFRGGRGPGRRSNQATKPTSSGRPFYDPPLAVLRFLTGWINSPRYSYSETYNHVLPGMLGRPGMRYRLGFTRAADVSLVSTSRNEDAGKNQKYDISSGFNLLGGIATDVKFSRSVSTDLIKRGNLYQSIGTSWPDLTIRIARFRYLPLLQGVVNKFIDVFSPRTSYTRTTKQTSDLIGGFVTSETENITQNPLLSLNFKLFRTLSLSSSYARTRESTTGFNRTNGSLQSRSSTVRKSVGATAQYSFTAPGGIKLPLFGKVKFRSTVNFSFDVKLNKSLTQNQDADGRLISSTTRSDLSIRPDISYTFSQQIRGGLTMRWTDTNTSNQVNHLREVQIWMEIRF